MNDTVIDLDQLVQGVPAFGGMEPLEIITHEPVAMLAPILNPNLYSPFVSTSLPPAENSGNSMEDIHCLLAAILRQTSSTAATITSVQADASEARKLNARTRDELLTNRHSLSELQSAMILQQAKQDRDAASTKELIDAMTNRFESWCREMREEVSRSRDDHTES